MSDPVHVLVVRAAGLPWALPMDSVEQTFGMRGRRIHDVAGVPLLIFRGQSLELLDLASALGQPCDGEPPEASITAPEQKRLRTKLGSGLRSSTS
jgi:chemotaxis protein histidine kinase CheA